MIRRKFLSALTATALTSSAVFAGGHSKDIVDTAVAAGSFTTLVAAVKAADLVDVLKGEGPFTVFAPTDEAFAALPAGTIDDLLKPENKDKLVNILTYHVLSGKVMAADIAGKQIEVEMVNGAKASIDKMSAAIAVPAPQKPIINENSMVKNDHSKPEKNWVELNPSFNVPHREYE